MVVTINVWQITDVYTYLFHYLATMSNVNADDNGAYHQRKKTSRIYSYIDGKVKTVYEENGEYYFNKRIVFNRFVKEYIPAEKVICLNRVYAKAKSFPLSRKIYTIANSTGGPISPYIGVLYVANKAISDNSKLKPHGNAKVNVEKPYVRTSKEILDKVKNDIEGKAPRKIFDQINHESGGVFGSSSQSRELRDTRQVYRQIYKAKSTKESSDDLENAIRMQRNG